MPVAKTRTKKTLMIVESPAKASTIGKYLGDDFEVKASVGHVRDLPKSNRKAIDVKAGFVPHYEPIPGKEAVIDEIKRLAKKADDVILATDPDREGEAIAWHVAEMAGLKKPKRVVFNEITKEAILEAVKNPREIDSNLLRAQEARRVLDRLFGYDLSGLIWKKVRYGLSAGRVQSPALRIIMEREREIRSFVPETYFVISADFKKGSVSLSLLCSKEPNEKKEAERIVEEAKKNSWSIVDIKETEVSRSPRSPFITSTLQQAASTFLGFSPSRTMQIAQKLYEGGHITYMRTDSPNLSKDAQGQILHYVEKEFGKEFVQPRNFKSKSKNAQEAHEAIRPSKIAKEVAGSNDEQKRLYNLIWRRAVASQMSDAKLLRTKIIANIENKNIPDFAVTGSRVLFPGWLKVEEDHEQDERTLPEVKVGDTLSLEKIYLEEKQTEPPGRYTEAGLVKELEKRGIGRPSTYAATIKTITDRGYVRKEGKTLFPTDTGEVVSVFLEENFATYVSDTFTAEMEESLDDIAEGTKKYEKVLKDFYTTFTKDVKAKESIEKITNLGPAPKEFPCPLCNTPMIIKLGRGGKFMSCSRFPDCAGARTIDGSILEGPKETGEKCPECTEGKLVERDGKFGRFVACSRYPKCKYIKKEDQPINGTGVTCPVCTKGEMAERRGRFGIFYSCSNYPTCRYAIKARPTGNTCSYDRGGKPCGALMMDGTKTIPERCSDKTCPNHNPHKIAVEK